MRPIASLLALVFVQHSHESTVHGSVSSHRSSSGEVEARTDAHIKDSYWYDWGIYGPFPRRTYRSFGAESPWPNLLYNEERCQNNVDGYIFIGPRGKYVPRPGPMTLDNDGNLIWLDTRWDQAMDVSVQRYRNEDYITFWTGDSTKSIDFGLGSYIMLDKHYEVFKEIKPAGDYLGDFHEFRLTDDGTALITIYSPKKADLSSHGGPTKGWLYDSIFQEIDLATDKLLFEWRASDHFAVDQSGQHLRGRGSSEDQAFDFFHINSIDKTPEGDYIISGRYYNIACVDGNTGAVKWQLGGKHNDFKDLSNGAATSFTWNHHVTWHEADNGTQITLFDNGATNLVRTAEYSRGMLLDIDVKARTVRLVQEYISPLKLSSPSQGSIQVLPSSNIFVGWGHTAAWTEFSADGEVLCETHFEPVWFANFGWAKSYRTFKSRWIGRPNTLPDRAMRASESALYVSWNGATEVARWRLESGPRPDGDGFIDHHSVEKEGFETRLEVPSDAGLYLRVAALGKSGGLLEYSAPVRKDEETKVKPIPGAKAWMLPEPIPLFGMSLLAALGLGGLLWYFRGPCRKAFVGLIRRGVSGHRYQSLPTTKQGES